MIQYNRNQTMSCMFYATLVLLLMGGEANAATLPEQISALEDPANFAAVVKSGGSAVAGLSAALNAARADLAAQALGQIKAASAIPALLTLVESKDGELRATAAWALGECCGTAAPSSEVCAALMKLFQDPYPAARSAAVVALAQLRTPDAATNTAIAGVIQSALIDPDEQTRMAAVNAIRVGNRKDLFYALTPLLDYQIDMVAPAAAQDAKRPKEKEQAPALVESVVWKEASPRVRLAIINTLAALRVSDSLPALITALERESSFNRQAIIKTLEAAGDPSNPARMTGTAGVCLGRIVPLPYDGASFEKYMPILINNGTLAVIAGRLGDERSIPYLLETLKLPHQKLGGDKDLTELFIRTIELLGKYKVERAARSLVALLKEVRIKQVSEVLQISIRQIGHTAARPLAAFGTDANAGGDAWQMAPTFFRMLREPNLRTRAARETIIKFIAHESDEVRMEATETLGLYLAEGLLDEYDEPMLDAMYLDSNREVRASCAKWKAQLTAKPVRR